MRTGRILFDPTTILNNNTGDVAISRLPFKIVPTMAWCGIMHALYKRTCCSLGVYNSEDPENLADGFITREM